MKNAVLNPEVRVTKWSILSFLNQSIFTLISLVLADDILPNTSKVKNWFWPHLLPQTWAPHEYTIIFKNLPSGIQYFCRGTQTLKPDASKRKGISASCWPQEFCSQGSNTVNVSIVSAFTTLAKRPFLTFFLQCTATFIAYLTASVTNEAVTESCFLLRILVHSQNKFRATLKSSLGTL